MRTLGFITAMLLLPALSLAAGTVYFSPSWALKTKDGRYIDVVSLSTTESKEGDVLLVYETTSGKEGFLPAKNLENDEELIAAIELARDQKNKLYEQPYKPVQNRRVVSRPRHRASSASSIIAGNCRSKWGTNYEMVEYCIKEQTSAYNRISRMNGGILARCKEKWGTNYEMVEYCTKNQTSAYNRLKSRRGSKAEGCRRKWGRNYEMVEYCIEN